MNVIVLFSKQEIARNIRNLLVRSGFEVTAVCVTGAQTMVSCEELEHGIVICGYQYSDMVYTDLREYLPERIEMIVLASRQFLQGKLPDGVIGLGMPLKSNHLIETTRQLTDNIEIAIRRQKRHKPRQRTREEQELLDDVKKRLMENKRISEEEAHYYIQQRSMNSGVGLMEMARMIRDSLTTKG